MKTAKRCAVFLLCEFGLLMFMVLIAAWGQTTESILLPEPHQFTGIVVDQDGRPIVGARIVHPRDHLDEYLTDSSGRFELHSGALALVVRKAGYRSVLLRTLDSRDARIILIKSGQTSTFPACPASNAHGQIKGWGGVFQFPKTPGVRASQETPDVDYVERGYKLKTQSGHKWIIHGMGPMWSSGEPEDQDIWRSVQYSEIVYDFDGQAIIDAKGKSPDGKCWRQLGASGETVAYSGVDCGATDLLDRFLDHACILPAARP